MFNQVNTRTANDDQGLTNKIECDGKWKSTRNYRNKATEDYELKKLKTFIIMGT